MVSGLQVRFRVLFATHLVLYKKACASCIVHDARTCTRRKQTIFTFTIISRSILLV